MNMSLFDSCPTYKRYWDKLMEIIQYAEEGNISIDSIEGKFFNIYPEMARSARTEEQRAILKEAEREMTECYQRALERNYNAIKEFKSGGVSDHRPLSEWILTLDADGCPKRTSVVGINKKGYPVYADGCSSTEISYELQKVWDRQYELRQWLETSVSDLYLLRDQARELKTKDPLGMSPSPEPNYDLSGLSGGQLDAAAWQNYTIEMGMARRTDYDETLDRLLLDIDTCIDFYEKAISIV